MQKRNLLQDIKPISRRNALPPGIAPEFIPPRQTFPPPPPLQPAHPAQSLPREVPFEPNEPRGSSRYGLWYLAAFCVIGLLFSLSFLFEHAIVTVTPKTLPVAFDSTDSFTANKDSTTPGDIVYTEMTLSGDESIKLPSTTTKDEDVPATGEVDLYNIYSTSPYKLVKGTRLSSSSGTIYKIDTAVTIPGYTKSDGAVTPGSVQVSATAAVAGEAGNIDNSDFTIPGLAGTPQAAKIYGRTDTAMAGGLSGTIYTIDSDAANAALGTLQTKLKASLEAKAKVQVPDGYIFYDGATVFTTDSSVQAPYSKTSDVPLALHGTLTAYLIEEDTLVAAIAKKSITDYANEPVTIPQLPFVTLVSSGTLNPDTDTSFSFSLAGSADIVWTVNPDDVKAALAGRSKAGFQPILSSQTAIDKAQVVIKPFWKQSFPGDVNRIDVIIQKPSP